VVSVNASGFAKQVMAHSVCFFTETISKYNWNEECLIGKWALLSIYSLFVVVVVVVVVMVMVE